MTGYLAIALGDVTGIGPEVTLKAVAQELSADNARYLLIGDEDCLRRVNAQLALGLDLRPYSGPGEPGRVFFRSPAKTLSTTLEHGAAAAARASLSYLEDGA